MALRGDGYPLWQEEAVMDRLPKEKVAELGHQIFEDKVSALVEDRDPQDHVAIDVETGDFEVGPDRRAIIGQLRSRRPTAQIYLRLVGSRVSVRFGWRAPFGKLGSK
jgi:hypothetical protein